MSSLANQVVVITGSSRGFGRAMAAEFQRARARVVISSRDAEAIQRAVAALTNPAAAFGKACDVRELDQVCALAEESMNRFGQIDIWVNNAGSSAGWGKMLDIDPGRWRDSFDTNVIGTYNGCRAALEKMLPVRHGRIINILGMGWDQPAPNQSPYGTSKAAIAMLTRTLALEYAESGVIFNTVQPGMMWTELLTRAEGVSNPTLRTRMEWAMRVFGNPPQVPARRVVYMAEHGMENGKTLRVVTPRMFVPRMVKEMLGGSKRNPRPWE